MKTHRPKDCNDHFLSPVAKADSAQVTLIVNQTGGSYYFLPGLLPGVSSSPIVTKLRQSYPWPQRKGWFGRSMSVGEVCALLSFS